jgi:O-antigen/teichoic acid export membrane protein
MDSTIKPALLLMSGRALGFAAAFLIPVVLVRIFDPAVFGTYKQLFLIYGTLYGMIQLGMAESLFYFLPSDSRKGGRYVFNSILVITSAGLVCLGLIKTAGTTISGWMSNPELSTHMTLIGLYLLLTMASAVLEIVMISRKRYLWASGSYAFSDLLRAGLFIIPALLFERLEWLLMGGVVFASLRLAAAIIYIWREFNGELRPDAALLKKQLAYALPFAMALLIYTLQANLHQYVISYYYDAATFAIYAVGCLQIPLVDFMMTSAGNVMMVRMGERIREGRPEAVPAIWHDTTRKLALIFFPLVGLLLASAPELITVLFTQSYRASVPIYMLWSTSILFSVLMTDAVLRVYAETRFLLMLYGVRLLLIATLIHGFLAFFQLSGAVLVTLMATMITHGSALIRIGSLMRLGFRQILPWRSLAAIFSAASMACLFTWTVKLELGLPTLPLLLMTVLVYTASYSALAFRFGLLSENERLAVIGWLKKRPAVKEGTDLKSVPLRKEGV